MKTLLFLALTCCIPGFVQAQDPAAAKLIEAQQAAMKKLDKLNGVWRGPAWTVLRGGEKHHLTQTERIGPFLDGSVKVVEGKGYESDGKPSFNAFGIISYDPARKVYSMRSYAMGRSGDYPLVITDSGYKWEIVSGPMTIRYSITIQDNEWKEIGERIQKDKEPVQFFEMNLKRIGDTHWPVEGTIPPK
jgi:hypothetical protein